MRSRWLSLALLLLCSLPIVAQQPIDSLQKLYRSAMKQGDEVNAAIYLSELGFYFYHSSQRDSARKYFLYALQVNSKVKNDSMIASNLNDLGGIFSDKGEYDSALHYYEKSLAIFRRTKDIRIPLLEVNLAKLYREKGNYEKALELLFSAARVLETRELHSSLGSCYNSIGITYRLDGDYNRSLVYHRKALAVRKLKDTPANVAGSLNNIGNVMVDLRNYDSARYYFNKALEIKRTLTDKKSIASTLHNLGDVERAVANIEGAEEYYFESLKLKRESSDKVGEVQTLIGLAECSLIRKSFDLALSHLDQAATLETSIGGLLEQRSKMLQVYVKVYRAKGEYRKASDVAEELKIVSDSLLNLGRAKALARTQTIYETEKKEKEIEILNKEKELNQTSIKAKNSWIAALVISITLMVVIIILIYNSFRIARKGRRRVETLMKELHHRVKNNLQILSSVLSLQSQHLTDENALLSVRSTEGRINAMALIHRKLYSDATSTIVSTRGYFRELVEYLVSSYGFEGDRLKLIIDIDEVELDVDKAIPLGLIANELISNTFKHAYVNHDQAELSIRLRNQGQQLELTIKDNGGGFQQRSITDEEKFGNRMVTILVKDLKGTYSLNSENGTAHMLSIPLT